MDQLLDASVTARSANRTRTLTPNASGTQLAWEPAHQEGGPPARRLAALMERWKLLFKLAVTGIGLYCVCACSRCPVCNMMRAFEPSNRMHGVHAELPRCGWRICGKITPTAQQRTAWIMLTGMNNRFECAVLGLQIKFSRVNFTVTSVVG